MLTFDCLEEEEEDDDVEDETPDEDEDEDVEAELPEEDEEKEPDEEEEVVDTEEEAGGGRFDNDEGPGESLADSSGSASFPSFVCCCCGVCLVLRLLVDMRQNLAKIQVSL